MGKASKDKRVASLLEGALYNPARNRRGDQDIYYRKAKEEGWRARSAFKLLQVDEAFDIFTGVKNVVDLCAAPGSWSQVLSRQLYIPAVKKGITGDALPKIVSVDLQPIAPLEGVITIQGDITSLSVIQQIIDHFQGAHADLIVSDGAPDVTGLHDLDEFVQSQLILAAMTLITHTLRPGGTFVAKIFRGKDIGLLYAQLKIFFPIVHVAKPKSSRNSSIEAFIVCQDYSPPSDLRPGALREVLQQRAATQSGGVGDEATELEREVVPFLACGDLSGYDADQSYPLQSSSAAAAYTPLPPVQEPIAPPYKTALALERERHSKPPAYAAAGL